MTDDKFISDDGKHKVQWKLWWDIDNDATYEAWVCVDHHKLYYIDCVYDAQTSTE